MNRESWEYIKGSKTFHVHVYRRSIAALIFSLIFSSFLGLALFYIYLSLPDPDYYATDGVTPPVPLKSMRAANMSANALLEPDPPMPVEHKVIPQ